MKRVFSLSFASASFWARSLRPMVLALALVGAAAGCRADQLVELRLYPCEFAGMEPQAVTVEVSGFNDAGEVVESFEVSFDDIAATTFADGYATVGYRKHGDVVRARFRVGWFEAAIAGPIDQADAIAVYDQLDVPNAGEVLVIGDLALDCAELIAGDTETGTGSESSNTVEGSTSDTLDSSTISTSDTLDTLTSDTLDTLTSDTLDSSTSESSSTDTSETDTGGPPGPMVGDPCSVGFYCVGGPTPEDAGTPLFCDPMSMELESTNSFTVACGGSCIDNLAQPVDACGSIGYDAKCLCQSPGAANCAGATLGCVAIDELHLCFQGKVVVGDCPSCATTPEGWYTCG